MSATTRFYAFPVLWLTCTLVALAVPGPGTASAAPPSNARDPDDADMQADTASGVVTSQAVTVAGHDFCQYFVAAWRDKEGSERYTLAIRERPSARWGSEMRIEFAQRRVYQTHLPPARAAIKTLSEDAAEMTYQAVLLADTQRRHISDADLAPDEF